MSNFLKDIIKDVGNEYATLVSDGVDSADVTNFIDTGSYLSLIHISEPTRPY